MEYTWNDTLAFGDAAADVVAAALQRQGHTVIDISKLKESQRRGVDLLVDDEYVDIKSDRYKPTNIFLEVECDGQPGCFWKSRADAWYYWFPKAKKLYRLDLPRLHYHIGMIRQGYEMKTVQSRNGATTWTATGLLVPVERLLSLGLAVDVSEIMKEAVA